MDRRESLAENSDTELNVEMTFVTVCAFIVLNVVAI